MNKQHSNQVKIYLIVFTAILAFFAPGCHEHCNPDSTPALQDHVGKITISGALVGEADGADVVMLDRRTIRHCVPTDSEDFCFTIYLSHPTSQETYEITHDLGLTETKAVGGDVVKGTIVVHKFEVSEAGTGTGSVGNTAFQATLFLEANFSGRVVTIDLEIDYEERAELECSSHLVP